MVIHVVIFVSRKSYLGMGDYRNGFKINTQLLRHIRIKVFALSRLSNTPIKSIQLLSYGFLATVALFAIVTPFMLYE